MDAIVIAVSSLIIFYILMVIYNLGTYVKKPIKLSHPRSSFVSSLGSGSAGSRRSSSSRGSQGSAKSNNLWTTSPFT